jgi:hypothetical protein
MLALHAAIIAVLDAQAGYQIHDHFADPIRDAAVAYWREQANYWYEQWTGYVDVAHDTKQAQEFAAQLLALARCVAAAFPSLPETAALLAALEAHDE